MVGYIDSINLFGHSRDIYHTCFTFNFYKFYKSIVALSIIIVDVKRLRKDMTYYHNYNNLDKQNRNDFHSYLTYFECGFLYRSILYPSLTLGIHKPKNTKNFLKIQVLHISHNERLHGRIFFIFCSIIVKSQDKLATLLEVSALILGDELNVCNHVIQRQNMPHRTRKDGRQKEDLARVSGGCCNCGCLLALFMIVDVFCLYNIMPIPMQRIAIFGRFAATQRFYTVMLFVINTISDF